MFQESNLFEELFEEIVARCVAAGLVKGEHMSVDGSFIQANADHHSRVPREQLAEVAKVNGTVREWRPATAYALKYSVDILHSIVMDVAHRCHFVSRISDLWFSRSEGAAVMFHHVRGSSFTTSNPDQHSKHCVLDEELCLDSSAFAQVVTALYEHGDYELLRAVFDKIEQSLKPARQNTRDFLAVETIETLQ